ncbi:MAG: LysR family transcriptional regulator [Rhodospirillales bacterium]|jgi:DNA-binding transcriptional LysR family regulator|nr:LysR family transcriptional regulator [Rhodospirillales bacterium]MBT4039158.1 LysR family transcriptional regulator [Rhodospirillales bacterium]MBT4628310.1 LysR family transcriptional regulator [Rhodospirillales bacterium]MBT5352324.1 LysR family transcriptional regulator [Rhodospirillales bacterium]MBT5520970.1 LysR family transcriptional regulator [Rhodospirillales bacterium]
MDSLNGIHTFTRVVEIGSFTGAAASLGQTKSSVSKQVAKLEDRLGARLLNRTTRRMSPTEAGQAFYERCQRIITDIEDAERSVTNLQDTPRGLLRINAPMSFSIRHLAPVISEFMQQYPDLQVDLDLNDRVVDVVEEGYDLVIRIARLPDSTLIARKLAPFHRIVCASPAYWDQHGRPQTPGDLRHHNCLLYKYLSSGNEWSFISPTGEDSIVRISGTFTSNNGDALLAAARQGLGVLATPSFISCDDVLSGVLEPVLEDYSHESTNIYAVYPHNRHLSAKVRLFVDYMVEQFGSNSSWDKIC